MPKKSTDPFMGALWSALVADKLGPGGNQTGWAETPVRIRNRFIRAARAVLQSGAAFQASALEVPVAEKSAARSGKKAPSASKGGKPHGSRELQLPLMSSVASRAEPGKKNAGAKRRGR